MKDFPIIPLAVIATIIVLILLLFKTPSDHEKRYLENKAIQTLNDNEIIIVKDSIFHFYIDRPEKDITLSKEEIEAMMILADGRAIIIEKIIVE